MNVFVAFRRAAHARRQGASPLRRALSWGVLLAAAVGLILAAFPAWRDFQVRGSLREARQAVARAEYETAQAALERAARIAPENADVEYLRAVVSRRSGDLESMARRLRRAEQLGWSPDDIQRQKWLAQAQTGEVDAVMPELTALLNEGASDEAAEEIYDALVKGHLSRYRLHDAGKCLAFWLEWRPEHVQAHLYRADIYTRMGDLNKAIDDYQAVLHAAPGHQQATLEMAGLLLESNRVSEARPLFVQALDRDPQSVPALLGLAQCDRRLVRPDAARDYAEKALALADAPEQRAAALAELGQMQLDQHQTDEALRNLTEAAQLAPAESTIRHALANALTLAGKPQEAAAERRKAAVSRDDYSRLTEITSQLLETPDDAELRAQAGLILMRQGMADEGARWLLTAVDCDPRHRASHQALAEYYARRGETQRAARHRLAAAQAAPGPAQTTPQAIPSAKIAPAAQPSAPTVPEETSSAPRNDDGS